MRRLISLLLSLLILTSSAFACTPTTPIDPTVAETLLPGYSQVDSIDDGDVVRLLMSNAKNELVFVGGVRGEDDLWRFTESTPLPEGTSMDSTGTLTLPTDTDVISVELRPYADGTWGLSHIAPASIAPNAILLYKHVICTYYLVSEDTLLGDHPWSDVTTIDWTALPASYEEARAALDSSHWAVTSSPDPLDRIRLRSAPSIAAETIGSYYNSTPVYIREVGREWCAVTVGGVDGWMMTRYLVNGASMGEIPSAVPVAVPKRQATQLHVQPSRNSEYLLRELEYADDSAYILGMSGYWYHVWLPKTEEYGYAHVDDFGH